MNRLLKTILVAFLSNPCYCFLNPSFNANFKLGPKRFLLNLANDADGTVKTGGVDDIPSEILPSDLRKGAVLLARPDEYSHFLMRAAVFIFEHGKRETEGVILQRPTAFTCGETAPGIGVFSPNTLYMGGENGVDMALMFHKYPLDGLARYCGAGIYLGGLKQAKELVESRKAHPRDFKFIFNHVSWAPGKLEKEIQDGRWDVVAVPPDLVLNQDASMCLWSKARNKLASLGHSRGDADA